MKTFLETSLTSVDQDIIEFVESKEFERFAKIMNQFYLQRLLQFHAKPTSADAAEDKAWLNIYLNLPNTLQLEAERIIEERRRTQEESPS